MNLPHRGRGSATAALSSRNAMTEVELIRVEKRLEHWLRFGRIAAERIVSSTTRVASFRPDATFALVRWSSNELGTIHSRIDIVRAVRPDESHAAAPFVRPGGELYLSIQGWPDVRIVLEAIDAIEAAGVDPCDVAPDHWRHVHSRLSAGKRPRPYTAERHRAWLKRKTIEP